MSNILSCNWFHVDRSTVLGGFRSADAYRSRGYVVQWYNELGKLTRYFSGYIGMEQAVLSSEHKLTKLRGQTWKCRASVRIVRRDGLYWAEWFDNKKNRYFLQGPYREFQTADYESSKLVLNNTELLPLTALYDNSQIFPVVDDTFIRGPVSKRKTIPLDDFRATSSSIYTRPPLGTGNISYRRTTKTFDEEWQDGVKAFLEEANGQKD